MNNQEIINKDINKFVAQPSTDKYWDSERAIKLMDLARADEREQLKNAIDREAHNSASVPLTYSNKERDIHSKAILRFKDMLLGYLKVSI